MRSFYLILMGLSLSACATRTVYQPHGESGGYSEAQVNDDIYMARFAGNAYTSEKDAEVFSMFRSIEICIDQGFKFSKILAVDEQTKSKTVRQSSTYVYQTPIYYNSYSKSTTGGNAYGSTYSWDETYKFPVYDTYFTCKNETYQVAVDLQSRSDDDMKDLTIDKMGAVQVVEITNESPSYGILQVGDFITKINSKRIRSISEFSSAVDLAPDKNKIPTDIIREGKVLKVNLKARNNTDFYLEMNVGVIRSVCPIAEIKERPLCQAIYRMPSSVEKEK